MIDNRKKNYKTKFKRLSNIFDDLVILNKKTKLKTGLMKINDAWKESVDATIFKNATPHFFKKGTLVLKVTDSTWMQHLQYLQKEMIKKMNSNLSEDLVKKIKFSI